MQKNSRKFRMIFADINKYKDPYSATVKNYGGHKKKLTVCKTRVRQSGVEKAVKHTIHLPRDDPKDPPAPPNGAKSPPKAQAEKDQSPPEKGQERLSCNLSRARSTIFELALCNEWEWFFTFTLDPAKYDRSDLKTFQKDLSRFFRNYRARKHVAVKYLLIPEQHSDGVNWHMHGFLMGLPESHLRAFTLEEHLPSYIRQKLTRGDPVYEWEAYSRKFGFCDIEPINDLEATAKYATKYVSKSMDNGVIEANGHLYYASQGLKRATITARGYFDPFLGIPFDFENEYVKIRWYDGGETPEDLVHPDDIAKKLRCMRQEALSQLEPPLEWEPLWDMDTGEIYDNPFDNPDTFHVPDTHPPTVEKPALDPPKDPGKRKARNPKQEPFPGQISFLEEEGRQKTDGGGI